LRKNSHVHCGKFSQRGRQEEGAAGMSEWKSSEAIHDPITGCDVVSFLVYTT
jgi:hypothetical protein